MSAIVEDFLVNWLGYIPGVGAAIISIRNWWVLRKGADITPLPIVNYGLWAIKSGDKTNKMLILPLLFNNDGVKNGLVVNVEVSFSSGGQYKPIQIRRKIRLNDFSEQEMRNMNLTDFRNKVISSVNPSFPVPVYAHEGNTAMFEGFDGDNAIPIGKETMCQIKVIQQDGKTNSIEFPFRLTQEQFDNTVNNLSWY
jgi:hypothetical protein